MNNPTLSTAIFGVILLNIFITRMHAEQPSEFDEAAIRTMQETSLPSAAYDTAWQEFEAASGAATKAAKWEQLVIVASQGMLSTNWPPPPAGWKLIVFPASGNLTLQDVREQAWEKVYSTKLVAQNDTEAVRLRAAGGLLVGAVVEGEEWASMLLLDVAQRPDSNIKRLAYWFTQDFAIDWNPQRESESGVPSAVPVWQVDWNAWQQAYNAANALGKAIILRNVTMLGIRREQVTTAAAINLAALSGTDRELKSIALAFGAAALGSAVTAKWAEIAADASDPQMQALAQEARSKFGEGN